MHLLAKTRLSWKYAYSVATFQATVKDRGRTQGEGRVAHDPSGFEFCLYIPSEFENSPVWGPPATPSFEYSLANSMVTDLQEFVSQRLHPSPPPPQAWFRLRSLISLLDPESEVPQRRPSSLLPCLLDRCSTLKDLEFLAQRQRRESFRQLFSLKTRSSKKPRVANNSGNTPIVQSEKILGMPH